MLLTVFYPSSTPVIALQSWCTNYEECIYADPQTNVLYNCMVSRNGLSSLQV